MAARKQIGSDWVGGRPHWERQRAGDGGEGYIPWVRSDGAAMDSNGCSGRLVPCCQWR